MTDMLSPATARAAYPLWTQVQLRYNDHDGQGHVNNAIFSTFFEAGRVKYIRDQRLALLGPSETFVVVRAEIDFRAELHWPGTVDVGLRALRAGNRSYRFGQAVFNGDLCVATGEFVLVLLDRESRKSKPLGPALLDWLNSIKSTET
jgi:acyl-CoA thioester hydrolase